jgi:hypothetical protein
MDSAHSLQDTLNPIIFAPMEIELEINNATITPTTSGHPHTILM